MTIRIDHELATRILYEEHSRVKSIESDDEVSTIWFELITKLSELCPYRKSSTFIAAIGTAILAKTVNSKVDVYCLLDRDGQDNSYSGRSLVDNVWAKHRSALDIDLGANGANPLNNTPFIGKSRIDQIKNVRNVDGYEHLLKCLELLQGYTEIEKAKSALRGFIRVRSKTIKTTFDIGENAGDHLVITSLIDAIKIYVNTDSEDGRRAQSVAASLISIVFGLDRINVGHINDPDRNFPLDIIVFDPPPNESNVSIAIEVKDKPVGLSEVYSSIDKILDFNVKDIIYLALSNKQKNIDFSPVYERARNLGIKLVIFTEWNDFVSSCIALGSISGQSVFPEVFKAVGDFSLQLGVSQKGLDLWSTFSSNPEMTSPY